MTRFEELKWEIYNLTMKANKIGQFKGSTTTCQTIPVYLYDKLQSAWREMKEIDPTFTLKGML